MGQGPLQPVPLPPHPHVTRPEKGQRLGQTPPVVAGATGLVLKPMPFVHPRRPQRIALLVGGLPVELDDIRKEPITLSENSRMEFSDHLASRRSFSYCPLV